MLNPSPIRQDFADAAEAAALQALSFLLIEKAYFSAFQAETGCVPEDLAALVRDKSFLASVLDFLLADEGRAAEFSAQQSYLPGELARLRQGLPGGDLPHWT
jgi:hypothetical protein